MILHRIRDGQNFAKGDKWWLPLSSTSFFIELNLVHIGSSELRLDSQVTKLTNTEKKTLWRDTILHRT
jgi:hypothetical protein